MEIKEEGVSELEDESIEIMLSKQKGRRLKKKIKMEPQGWMGPPKKVEQESQERRKSAVQKKYLRK